VHHPSLPAPPIILPAIAPKVLDKNAGQAEVWSHWNLKVISTIMARLGDTESNHRVYTNLLGNVLGNTSYSTVTTFP
jgi:hypothetical protein